MTVCMCTERGIADCAREPGQCSFQCPCFSPALRATAPAQYLHLLCTQYTRRAAHQPTGPMTRTAYLPVLPWRVL